MRIAFHANNIYMDSYIKPLICVRPWIFELNLTAQDSSGQLDHPHNHTHTHFITCARVCAQLSRLQPWPTTWALPPPPCFACTTCPACRKNCAVSAPVHMPGWEEGTAIQDTHSTLIARSLTVQNVICVCSLHMSCAAHIRREVSCVGQVSVTIAPLSSTDSIGHWRKSIEEKVLS